ncbi:MAG TPA: hypothetical protein DEW10_01735, partial [Bifidobacterium sp.]|nr:hypothetical protein [Bifidobacterium sp.]
MSRLCRYSEHGLLDRRARDVHVERDTMFDTRLFSLTPGIMRLIVAKVLCQWVGLLSNVVFVLSLVTMLEPVLSGIEVVP